MNKIFIALTTIVTLALSACSDTRAQTSGENKQEKTVADGSNAPAKISAKMQASITETLVEESGEQSNNAFAWALYQDEELTIAVFQQSTLQNQLGGIQKALNARLHKFTPEQAENVVRLAKQYSPYPEVHELIEKLPKKVQSWQINQELERKRLNQAKLCRRFSNTLQNEMYELDASNLSVKGFAIKAKLAGCNDVADEAERILQFRSGFGK